MNPKFQPFTFGREEEFTIRDFAPGQRETYTQGIERMKSRLARMSQRGNPLPNAVKRVTNQIYDYETFLGVPRTVEPMIQDQAEARAGIRREPRMQERREPQVREQREPRVRDRSETQNRPGGGAGPKAVSVEKFKQAKAKAQKRINQ